MENKHGDILLGVDENNPLEYFKRLLKIPRRSGDEQRICASLTAFANHYGLQWKKDTANNLLICKQGTQGRENSPPIVLQAHMDMVFESRDLEKHPYEAAIKLVIGEDGDTAQADGTSLGADDGLGMALILAILASNDISHPPVEALFTTMEEDGLLGAAQLQADWLKGKLLLNLDGETETKVTAGCAGAFRAEIQIPISTEACIIDKSQKRLTSTKHYKCIRIEISRLYGGHSGLDIHRHRANANVLMGHLLWELGDAFLLRICYVSGGSHMNTIPTSASVVIAVPISQEISAKETINCYMKMIGGHLSGEDSGFLWNVMDENEIISIFDEKTTNAIRNCYLLLQNGVQTMSKDISDMVQTSTNIGQIQTNKNEVRFICNPRSSNKMELNWMRHHIEALSGLLGAEVIFDSDYPSWEFAESSYLRLLYMNIYEFTYNKKMQVEILHGGLECGLLIEKYCDLDAISIGPEIRNVHTTAENFSLSSLERVWYMLQELLKQLT